MFKKTFKNILEYPDTWSVLTGENEGNPLTIRFRAGAKEAVGHPEYPFQIGVAVPLLRPNEQKLPEFDESVQLDLIEGRLVSSLLEGNETFFVMVVTTTSMREFVFYAKEWKPEYFENKVREVEKSTATHQLQFMMKPDENWETFKFFI